MRYKDQLLTEEWKLKREYILKRDNYECQLCKETNKLNVHHFYYLPNTKAWEYPDNALITYCEVCHNKWHEYKTQIDQLLKLDFISLSLITGMISRIVILDSCDIALMKIIIDDILNFGFNFNRNGRE